MFWRKMSKVYPWKKLRETKGICNDGLDEVIAKLGGDGITLEQARKACKDETFPFYDAVRAATALQLPNWKLALGRVVASAHPKAKEHYENEAIYLQNQKALEEGRLEDINEDAAKSAFHNAEPIVEEFAARATYKAARATECDDMAISKAKQSASYAIGVTKVDELIDIYFDTLEEDNNE